MPSEELQTACANVSRLIRSAEDLDKKCVDSNSRVFRELRNGIRANEALISPLLAYILQYSEKGNCLRRLIVLSVFDYFFNRSHPFRVAVIDNLQELLHLFVEIDPLHRPLPPPKEDAQKLKIEAIKIIKQWHEKFAVGYERLESVSDFLSTSKSLDFQRASAQLLAERQREEEKERKKREKAEKAASFITSKYDQMSPDIVRSLEEVRTALRILFPVFSERDEHDGTVEDRDSEQSSTSGGNFNKSLHGYAPGQTITVSVPLAPSLEISPENEALVSTVRDGRVMLEYYRKQVKKWLERLRDSACDQDIVTTVIQMKARLDSEIARIDELRLPEKRRKRREKRKKGEEESDSEESDLEDVPEKEIEHFVLPSTSDEIPSHILEKVRRMEKAIDNRDTVVVDEEEEPCCSKIVESEKIEKPTSSVPVVSFGLDIKYWEDRPKDVEVPKNNADCHRFWRAPDESDTSKELDSVYSTRVITFIGEGRKSSKTCRSRLKSGKLCPRQDVERCPIHGPIVDRDDEGFPIEPLPEEEAKHVQDSLRAEIEKEEEEFIRDVESATGRNLHAPVKRSSGRNRKDNVPEAKAVRDRLEKKLLDKRTIIRVSAHLDAVRKAKIEKQFGGQYVHAFTKK